jgi:hypothetical protein
VRLLRTRLPLRRVQRNTALVFVEPYNRGDISTLDALRAARLAWSSWREARVAWNEFINDTGGDGNIEEFDEDEEVLFAIMQTPFLPTLAVASWLIRNRRHVCWHCVERTLDSFHDWSIWGAGGEDEQWQGPCRQLEVLRDWAQAAREAPAAGVWAGRLRSRDGGS